MTDYGTDRTAEAENVHKITAAIDGDRDMIIDYAIGHALEVASDGYYCGDPEVLTAHVKASLNENVMMGAHRYADGIKETGSDTCFGVQASADPDAGEPNFADEVAIEHAGLVVYGMAYGLAATWISEHGIEAV